MLVNVGIRILSRASTRAVWSSDSHLPQTGEQVKNRIGGGCPGCCPLHVGAGCLRKRAALTIATMPAFRASGKLGQTVTTRPGSPS